MHISTRTIIEVTSAAAAILVIADDYRALRKLQKVNVMAAKLMTYQAELIKRENTPMDQFDEIAINAIIDG